MLLLIDYQKLKVSGKEQRKRDENKWRKMYRANYYKALDNRSLHFKIAEKTCNQK